ncbi:MAG: hypothetical protein AAF517_28300 [Planctomycetota bacterium]
MTSQEWYARRLRVPVCHYSMVFLCLTAAVVLDRFLPELGLGLFDVNNGDRMSLSWMVAVCMSMFLSLGVTIVCFRAPLCAECGKRPDLRDCTLSEVGLCPYCAHPILSDFANLGPTEAGEVFCLKARELPTRFLRVQTCLTFVLLLVVAGFAPDPWLVVLIATGLFVLAVVSSELAERSFQKGEEVWLESFSVYPDRLEVTERTGAGEPLRVPWRDVQIRVAAPCRLRVAFEPLSDKGLVTIDTSNCSPRAVGLIRSCVGLAGQSGR